MKLLSDGARKFANILSLAVFLLTSWRSRIDLLLQEDATDRTSILADECPLTAFILKFRVLRLCADTVGKVVCRAPGIYR
jgi:hypothetical protein